MIDTFQELKLKLLKSNLNQIWTLPNEIWNEEIPHDYMYEDTYLQLSFVFNTFTENELKQLIKLTNNEKIVESQPATLVEAEAFYNDNNLLFLSDEKRRFNYIKAS